MPPRFGGIWPAMLTPTTADGKPSLATCERLVELFAKQKLGGIYLIGGVNRSLSAHFDRFGFVEAMRDKGRFGPFMEQFGVAIVTDDFAALTGCASHLSHQL